MVGTGLSEVVYYAKNIAGDSATPNQITVTFSQAAQFPDARVLEYSGLDTNSPLDTASGNAGSGLLADSGACTTTTAVELIVAGGTVGTNITDAGTGFTLLALTRPTGGNAQHQITSVAGSCEATAPLSTGDNWVMQSVAFKLPPPPVPDFTLGANPTSRTVTAGNSVTYAISATAVNGFNSAVSLTCSAGLPTGATCAFVPSSVTPGGSPGTSTLTISTTAAAVAGVANVTVTGTSGLLTHNIPISLTVNPAPDFTISAPALAPATVLQGGAATSTITVAPLNGFTDAVALTCSITPVVTPPPTCSFNPTPVPNGSGTSVLTVNAAATTPPGAFNIAVTGTAGAVSHNVSLSLTITGPPDFTVVASALSPATIAAGASATSTITIAPQNGFNSSVSLTCSIAPAANRGPTCSFNPSSVAGGSGTSTLTVNTTPATSASVGPRWRGVFYAMWLPISGLALLGTGFTSRRKKLLGLLLLCLLISGLIFLGACGGGSPSGGGNGQPGTPAGNYAVTVSATSGSLTHTVPVTVAVH